MELKKAFVPGIVALLDEDKMKDFFSTEEARRKFCNLAIDCVEKNGSYDLKLCKRCTAWCSRVSSIMGESSNY